MKDSSHFHLPTVPLKVCAVGMNDESTSALMKVDFHLDFSLSPAFSLANCSPISAAGNRIRSHDCQLKTSVSPKIIRYLSETVSFSLTIDLFRGGEKTKVFFSGTIKSELTLENELRTVGEERI